MSNGRKVVIGTTCGFAGFVFTVTVTVSLLVHNDLGAVLRGAAWVVIIVAAMVGLATWLDGHIQERLQPTVVYADRQSLEPFLPKQELPKYSLPQYDTSDNQRASTAAYLTDARERIVRKTRRRSV